MKEFTQLLNGIKDYLSGYKLKKANNILFVNVNDLWCKIEFQKSVSSDNEKVKFTINIGVTVNVFNEYLAVKNLDNPTEVFYPIGGRIGQFLPSQNDYWWTISENYDEVSTDVLNVLNDVILPFFSRYTQLDNVIALCEIESNQFLTKFTKKQILILIKVANNELYSKDLDDLKEIAITENLEEYYHEFVEKIDTK